MPDFTAENQAKADGYQIVAGIDEAGRGPWAGPVVAAAVILDQATLPDALISSLDDSKKLKAARREAILSDLRPYARIGIGSANPGEIDNINILQATFLAMKRAVEDLDTTPDLALVDGNRPPLLDCVVDCLIGGDGRSLSIAAASIVAKVHRDHLMAKLAVRYPEYGWERNAGYGTAEHKAALTRHGVTPEHRKSYKPIRNILGEDEG